MGFFSSRKPDDDYTHTDKSVVHVIRSRFYGKNKGKEREEASGTFVDPATSTAQTLSHPSKPIHSSPSVLSPSHKKTASNSQQIHGASTSKSASTMSPPPPPSVRAASTRSTKENRHTAPASPRKPADNATVTLAQRLNELASANADGLLNDDEYRMLRQNLFERFSTNTTVPSESPVVPATPRHHPQGSESSRMSTTSRPSSNFVVEVPRSPSIRSRSSVSSFFRRNNSIRHAPGSSKDLSDTSSIFSSTSGSTNLFRRLNKKSSSGSLSSVKTEASRPADAMSIASRRTADREYNSLPHINSPARSTASSIRRFANPPSSFPGARALPSDSKHDVFDEDSLNSSAAIREEMAAVEAERKRLMDAFNGLELSTLTKRTQRQGKMHESGSMDASTWTLIPDSRSLRRVGGDSDATSVRSGTSMSTSYTGRRVVRQKTSSSLVTTSSKPASLHRKNSMSSMSSGKGFGGQHSAGLAPPVPSIPAGLLSSGFNGSSSSINMARSTGHLPMSSVPEDDVKSVVSSSSAARHAREVDLELEREMQDIRRRREEVGLRYDGRLEYLRAKLKGAQLHEKLMKK